MYRKLLFSGSITSVVSAAFGLAAYFFNVTFWGVFISAFLLQIIFFYVWNSYQITKATVKLQEYNYLTMQELAKQSTLVSCAYCKHTNLVPIILNSDNESVCEKCGKTSSVYVSIETAQKTAPLSTVALTHASLPDEVREQLEKQEEKIKNGSPKS